MSGYRPPRNDVILQVLFVLSIRDNVLVKQGHYLAKSKHTTVELKFNMLVLPFFSQNSLHNSEIQLNCKFSLWL